MFNSQEYRRAEARLRLIFNELQNEIANRNWNEPIKSWSDFTKRFTMPKKDFDVISNRIMVNCQLYQTNYLLIYSVSFFLYILFRPTAIFIIGAIIATFVYVINSPRPIVISGRHLSRIDKYRAFVTLSMIILTLTGVLSSILRIFTLCTLVVLTHAIFRHTTLRHKVSQQIRNQSSGSW